MTGALHQKQVHAKTICLYEPVQCPLYIAGSCTKEDCSGSLLRKDLPDHIFISKKSSIAQICSLAKQNSATKQQIALQTKQLADLKAVVDSHVVEGFTSKRLANGIVFCGSVPSPVDSRHSGILVDTSTTPPHRVYCGELLDFAEDGHGVVRYTWGNQYVGEWKAGKMHGRGTFRYTDGMYTVHQNFKLVTV